MSDFDEIGCGLVAIDTDLHPYVQSVYESYISAGWGIWPPGIQQSENRAYLSGLHKTVELIIGTDTNTGESITLTQTGKDKIGNVLEHYEKYSEDTLSKVTVDQVFVGGIMVNGITQNYSTQVLDFTSIGGLYDGIIGVSVKIKMS